MTDADLAKTIIGACRDLFTNIMQAIDGGAKDVPRPPRATTKQRGRPRNLSKQRRVDEIFHGILQMLADHGGTLRGAEICDALERRAPLCDGEHGVCAAGAPKILVKIHFLSSLAVHAGYITKQRGVWRLTAAGTEALSRHSDELPVGREIVRLAREKKAAQRTAA